MWTLVLMLQSGGGVGSPQPPVFGGGVACGVGVGLGAGPGVAVGAGFGVGVGIVGIETLSTPELGAFGDALGAVGSSSVIVWQLTRTRAAAPIP
jgi:hypothetical protein